MFQFTQASGFIRALIINPAAAGELCSCTIIKGAFPKSRSSLTQEKRKGNHRDTEAQRKTGYLR